MNRRIPMSVVATLLSLSTYAVAGENQKAASDERSVREAASKAEAKSKVRKQEKPDAVAPDGPRHDEAPSHREMRHIDTTHSTDQAYTDPCKLDPTLPGCTIKG